MRQKFAKPLVIVTRCAMLGMVSFVQASLMLQSMYVSYLVFRQYGRNAFGLLRPPNVV
jgi:hypothetical protein